MPPFTFAAFQAHIDAEFWKDLSAKKLDEAKLSDAPASAVALYQSDKGSSATRLSCRIDLSHGSFETVNTQTHGSCIARGSVHNTNTLEDFQRKDKNQFLRDASKAIQEDISTGAAWEEPSLLVAFHLLCFADLKKYTYTHWMCYPAFPIPTDYREKHVYGSDDMNDFYAAVDKWHITSEPSQWGFFAYDAGARLACALSESSKIAEKDRIFCFADPSPNDAALGWPARNFLYLLSFKHSSVNLLSYTRGRPPILYKHCILNQNDSSSPPKPTGWERNNAGALRPRVANLASVLDPVELANDAVNLNLKLMQWRIVPELNLESIQKSKCLLLGAGTLGCSIARGLLAWGIKDITFLDSGRVSYSNPARQSLFEYTDCLNGGRPKAEAAAEALGRIVPGARARGISVSVPMIGHPYSPSDTSGREDYRALETAFDEHDVVFLLMDSRESRWLPTIMGLAKNKIVINAALGFDNWVVLRHGMRLSNTGTPHLGCYFCNDVVVPADSTSDRTLDQQCTVTRPGLAMSASAAAVELLASILQHPEKGHCPAPTTGRDGANETVLGCVPHTIRHYLRTWETKVLTGQAYPQCSACSAAVVNLYEQEGWDFVERAINETGYIDQISGLAAVQAGVEGINVDWDDSESEHEEGDEGVDDFTHL